MTMLRMVDKLINAENYNSVRKTVSKEFVESIKDSLASDYKELSERELTYQESLENTKPKDKDFLYSWEWPIQQFKVTIYENPLSVVMNNVSYTPKNFDTLIDIMNNIHKRVSILQATEFLEKLNKK